jgi:FkbM family methyltransferase
VLREIYTLSRQVGMRNALRVKAKHSYAQQLCKLGARRSFRPISVSVDGLAQPVMLRPATSDYFVFRQIFVGREYAPLKEFNPPKLIVDCGANVGYASAYFLSCFPAARLIALEPDPENFHLCRKNLLLYGGRAEVLQKALWSHPARLTLLHFGKLGDEGEMGVQVFEKIGDEFPEHVHRGINPPIAVGEVDALDMKSILEMGSPIDILKLDVEKAEMVIFNGPNLQWIKHVRNIVIELHNEEAAQRFRRAMEPYAYDFLTSGELSICKNIRPR